MFNRILIANRSAIACRIIRTCQRLDIETVAVYAPSEQASLHVELATHSVALPDSGSPVASYLDIRSVIEAALRSGAEAVHPGYGFLAENPDFAQACEKAGVTFVGPTAEVIALMGNKREARRRLAAFGVPVLPGTAVPLDGTGDLGSLTRSIGFPLMVKASEGGGGIGMHLVNEPRQLERTLRRTRSTSRRAFGSQDVYLEQFIPDARHIEVQIVGDADGSCTHLWERECSVQRRHQKVMEEAGSPSISDETRDHLIAAAVHAAEEVGYSNVGTFEFIVDPDDRFYFLEANTRLQVEHGTTEMVTGVDIVEQQLRVAAGDGVSIGAKPVNGHAIQCRIYAEDPETFIPSPGRLDEFQFPVMDGVRVDTGFRAGDEVSSYFDPLLAKVIAWGQTRNDSIGLMEAALAEISLDGVKSNISTLEWVLNTPEFRQGRYSTRLLEERR